MDDAPMNDAPMNDAQRVRQGMTVRREVLGDEHVDRAVAATTPFTEPFQDFITRYAWGDIWSRPGLSRAERSLITSWPAANGIRCVNPSIATASPSRIARSTASVSETISAMSLHGSLLTLTITRRRSP